MENAGEIPAVPTIKNMKTILCDSCQKDITYRSNSVEYRLVLKSEQKNLNSDYPVTDMWIEPDIKREHNFCDLSCLGKWITLL